MAEGRTPPRVLERMDPRSFFDAIAAGECDLVRSALAETPELAKARALEGWAPRGDTSQTALHHALLEGQEEIALALIESGADLEARNRGGRTPLHDSIEYGRERVRQTLLERGAHVDVAAAAILGDLDRVRELLDADPELANDLSTHLSPLGWASFGNETETARELISRGARMDDGELFCAASCGHVDVARVLLDHGADPNQDVAEWGGTPLCVAAEMRFTCDTTGIAEVLLEAGADVDRPNGRGETPLRIALEGARREALEHPLAASQDCKQFQALAEILRRHGASEPN